MPWPALADPLPVAPEAPGSDAAGAEAAGADAPPLDGLGVAAVPHADKTSTTTVARAGNLRWYRIPCLLLDAPQTGSQSAHHRIANPGPLATLTHGNRVRTIVCMPVSAPRRRSGRWGLRRPVDGRSAVRDQPL